MKKNLKQTIIFLILVSILTVTYVYAQTETERSTGEIKQDSGTYLGQIDPHSIEIRISGVPLDKDPRAFQLSGQVQQEFAGYRLKTGDQVKFSYTVEKRGPATVMTITRIEKFVESPEEGNDEFTGEIKQDSGTYLGQIDPHSIEIRISGVPLDKDPRAFQLSGQVQQEFAGYRLKTGDQVKFSYTVEKRGQATMMTITRIEKIKNQ